MNRWNVVRLDYLFSVIVPCLLALYVNNLPILNHLRTILGWAFLGIAGNVINDIIDKDRDLGWHQKELGAVAMGAIGLGIICFVPVVTADPSKGLWIGIAIILILAYCFKIKHVPVASSLVQVLAEIPMPYFTIHVPNSALEWTWLIVLYEFSVLSQFIHEAMDGEAITRFSPRQVQIIVYLISILVLGTGAVLFLVTWDYNILIFAFVPLAVMYIFRAPRTLAKSNIKDVGIIIGNLFMTYFLTLVLTIP